MRLLVTGGAGFIGSNFVRHWLAKHPQDDVVTLDLLTYAGHLSSLREAMENPRHQWVQGDICKPEDVERAIGAGVDAIVHFAAESHVDRSIYGPLAFVETNVRGTAVLLEAARRRPTTRFLLVSTDEVYGSLPLDGTRRFALGDPYQPRNPYAASKAAADHLARSYATTYGMDIIITNCTNNVGPFQDPEKFIPLAITNVLEGKPIRVYGDGRNVRDWLWVGDHVAGIEAALVKGKGGETYLFGGNSEIDNRSLATRILTKLNRPVSAETLVFVADRPGHDMRYALDPEKSAQELGWRATYDIDGILDHTIAWYQENSWWWKPIKERAEGVVIRHG